MDINGQYTNLSYQILSEVTGIRTITISGSISVPDSPLKKTLDSYTVEVFFVSKGF